MIRGIHDTNHNVDARDSKITSPAAHSFFGKDRLRSHRPLKTVSTGRGE